MSKQEIREILLGADKKKYSHVVIYVDTWDYDYFAKYVKFGENIKDYIASDPTSTIKVMEVYSLGLDIEMQLNENRSYHIEEYVPKDFNPLIEKALLFATEKHSGQTRKNGLPYISHPKSVADLIIKYKGNSKNITDLICAAYLHDTLEDTDTTFKELVENFNVEIAYLVQELTSDANLKKALGKDKYLAYKCSSMTSWALDLKLCDRLDNISDLNDASEEFRNKYFFETVTIINYLINNCKLTTTQKKIIKDIKLSLDKININTKGLVKSIN